MASVYNFALTLQYARCYPLVNMTKQEKEIKGMKSLFLDKIA